MEQIWISSQSIPQYSSTKSKLRNVCRKNLREAENINFPLIEQGFLIEVDEKPETVQK